MLDHHITLQPFQGGKDGRGKLVAVLGEDFEDLNPIGVDLVEDGPTFLVAGSIPRCGKTTLLQSWLIGLTRNFSPDRLQLIIIDSHTRTLSRFRKLPHVRAYAGQSFEVQGILQNLLNEIRQRATQMEARYRKDPDGFDRATWLEGIPWLTVVIDDYDRFASKFEEERRILAGCLAEGGDLGTAFLVSGNASELPRDFDDPLMHKMRKQGCGMLLGGTAEIDQFNNARLPFFQKTANLPPGRGFLIRRGSVKLYQGAVYWERGESADIALSRQLGLA